jgi:hypothetical protein
VHNFTEYLYEHNICGKKVIIHRHTHKYMLICLKPSPFWVELFVIELTATHTVYLVWSHLKLDKQVLASVPKGRCSKIRGYKGSKCRHSCHFSVIGILSLAKSVIPNFFFANVEFAQILIKIMHVYIIPWLWC